MIIGMPVYQGVDLLDVTGPHEIFSWMGDDVTIELIADKRNNKSITTRDGFTFVAPKTFEDASKLDVLWVPGGSPAALKQQLKPDSGYIDFLKKQSGAKYICSVCEGGVLLAASGLADGSHTISVVAADNAVAVGEPAKSNEAEQQSIRRHGQR